MKRKAPKPFATKKAFDRFPAEIALDFASSPKGWAYGGSHDPGVNPAKPSASLARRHRR